ncbi:MAG: DUF4091 domain-containing protein [Nitrospirae bacterium]|nr:DUF4091 domain-containing protein [Candidatus Manganitrophaceae bacterium]
MKRVQEWFVGIVILLLYILYSGSALAQTIWWDTGMVKLRQENGGATGDPIPAGADRCTADGCSRGGVNLSAARNEFEPFQIFIAATGPALSKVDVTLTDLSDGKGNNIAALANGRPKNMVTYREHYLSIAPTRLSSVEAKPGLWPDGLVPKIDEYFGEVRRMPGESTPAFPFTVAAGRKQGVWVDLYVPPGTPAGLYSGSAEVTVGGKVAATIPIRLTVHDFDLPSVPTLKTAYSVGMGEAASGHYGTRDLSNARYWELICLYTKEMLLHRLSNSNVIWPAPAWNSSLGKINWSLPAISTSCNQRYPQFLTGGNPNLLPNGKLPNAKVARARLRDGTGLSTTDVNSAAYYQDYIKHIDNMGWKAQLFYFLWDEPPYPSIGGVRRCDKKYNGAASSAWPGIYKKAKFFKDHEIDIPLMVTTSRQAIEDCFTNHLKVPDYTKYLDIWSVPNTWMNGKPKNAFPFNTNLRKSYDAIITPGKELWWYQACGSHGCGGSETGYPSPMVDLPAIYSRVYEWLTYQYQIGSAAEGPSTELYFETLYAFAWPSNDPWENLYYFTGNGDGTYFYPGRPDKIGGTHHIPIPSIRLKMLREGIEDYEYLAQVEAKKNRQGVDGKAWIKANILNPYLTAIDPADGEVKLSTYIWNKNPGSITSAAGLLRAREELAKVLASSPVSKPDQEDGGISSSDSFDRENSSSLGSMWNVYLPAFEINSSQVRNRDTASQAALRNVDLGSDQDVSADCKVTAAGNSCGVMARWSDADNYYYVRLDPGLGNVALFKRVNGVYSRLGVADEPMQYNSYYRLRLVVRGTTLDVYFADQSTPAIAVTDGSLAAGHYAGFRSYAAAPFTTYFNDFKAATP